MAWFPGLPKKEDLDEYQRLGKMGVDVICLNRPDLLLGGGVTGGGGGRTGGGGVQ
jgi:hypothetical protein